MFCTLQPNTCQSTRGSPADARDWMGRVTTRDNDWPMIAIKQWTPNSRHDYPPINSDVCILTSNVNMIEINRIRKFRCQSPIVYTFVWMMEGKMLQNWFRQNNIIRLSSIFLSHLSNRRIILFIYYSITAVDRIIESQQAHLPWNNIHNWKTRITQQIKQTIISTFVYRENRSSFCVWKIFVLKTTNESENHCFAI